MQNCIQYLFHRSSKATLISSEWQLMHKPHFVIIHTCHHVKQNFCTSCSITKQFLIYIVQYTLKYTTTVVTSSFYLTHQFLLRCSYAATV